MADHQEAANAVIAALACSIRGNWASDVRDRLYLIEKLVYEHFSSNQEMSDVKDWLSNPENWDSAVEDGRVMRDDWPGPYEQKCFGWQLELLGLEKECLGDCWESHVEE